MAIQPKDVSKGHFYVSIAKSSLRAAGCIGAILVNTNPSLAILVLAASFVWAEFLGIIEEIV
jgi:hypothetical protein